MVAALLPNLMGVECCVDTCGREPDLDLNASRHRHLLPSSSFPFPILLLPSPVSVLRLQSPSFVSRLSSSPVSLLSFLSPFFFVRCFVSRQAARSKDGVGENGGLRFEVGRRWRVLEPVEEEEFFEKMDVVKMEGFVRVEVKGFRGLHEWSCCFCICSEFRKGVSGG